jgi:hypothetical protein
VSVEAGGMTEGQHKDPKLALAPTGLCPRSYGLQNGALDPRFGHGLNKPPGTIIEDRIGNGWRAMVLDKGIDADSASSSGRKGVLKDANTLGMSNVLHCAWLILRECCVLDWSAMRSPIFARNFDTGSR